MKINTIDNQIIDTNKLPDDKAELIELIEKSGILKFVGDKNGACFVWGKLPNGEGWVTQLIKDSQDFNALLSVINRLVQTVTNGKGKIMVVDKDFQLPE